MTRILITSLCLIALSACASFNTEQAEEQRLKELCDKIDTQHLSHCPGNHVPPPPVN
ncbi:MAG: hypothetical protein ACSHXY_12015 [Alphaproteobacteria bacterium]